MPRAVCRCGQALAVPEDGRRVVCPKCGARVRVRLPGEAPPPSSPDGFIRFHCPCGRRLKVPAAERPTHGRCPDCGRVVPVPSTAERAALPPGHPETPTAEMAAADRATLERWVRDHQARTGSGDLAETPAVAPPRPAPEPSTALSAGASGAPRVEAGLRTCPRCGRPVHMQARTCPDCGAAVPRRAPG
jgi:predicted RNA-binding Zn-ribbon protein involved in translation (DUF1610 family)